MSTDSVGTDDIVGKLLSAPSYLAVSILLSRWFVTRLEPY